MANLMKPFFIVLFGLALLGCSNDSKRPIHKVYVYHDYMPFWSDHHDVDTLSHLFSKSVSSHTGFDLQVLPIKRNKLNQLIKAGEPIIVLWGNPKWFEFAKSNASYPIIWDSNILVAKKTSLTESSHPENFKGQSFCAVKGHKYVHLEFMFHSDQIERTELNSYLDCLSYLSAGKVDFTQMQRSSFYNQSFSHLIEDFKIIEPSQDSFSRHVLLFNQDEEKLKSFNQAIVKLSDDSNWKQGLESFGDDRFIKLFDVDLSSLKEMKVGL